MTILLLSACTRERAENEIYLGVISGPESELVEVAKDVAQTQYSLKIKIIEFEDYNLPNVALADGSIDANMFQHQPYLDLSIQFQGYDLVSIGKTFVFPIAMYSKKIKSLSELKDGATIAIPIDPSNGARALRLLAKAKLIDFAQMPDIKLSPQSILSNPKQLKFIELEAAQLPRVLQDVDAAIINTNYAIPSGLLPSEDALLLEDKNSPYANIVVIRAKDKNNPKYQKLMRALHSEPVLNKARELFKGQAIQAW